ncbi:MAG: hypothetical protein ACI4RT_05445 [Candidatus Spyradenecus sp.]
MHCAALCFFVFFVFFVVAKSCVPSRVCALERALVAALAKEP